MFRTIPRHEETSLGLPYPVILVDGAEEEIDDNTGERIGVSIPNLEGLVAAIAVTRALCPLLLDGSEVRFIRSVIGMSAKDLAATLDIDPATLSRWENGKAIPGGWADRQVRMAAIIMLRDRVTGLDVDDKAIVKLKLIPRPDGVWPRMEMKRVHLDRTNSSEDDGWDARSAA